MTIVNMNWPDIFRLGGALGTAHHGTSKGLLYEPPSYLGQKRGVKLNRFACHNRSGGACNVGIGFRLANDVWKFGRYDGTTYTDLTATAQTPAATTIQVAGADQTGFVFLSAVPFNAVSLNITTAETNAGGSTVVDHTVTYSIAGGNWATMATTTAFVDDFTLTDTVLTAAVKNLIFPRPALWVPTDGHTGLPADMYALYVTSAQREANDVAAIATGVEIAQILATDSLADNGEFTATSGYFNANANGVVAFFGTASAQNRVYAECEQWG